MTRAHTNRTDAEPQRPAPHNGSDYHPLIQTPPHSEQAEQAVLGALLLDNTALDRVADLAAEDFYQHSSRLIFGAITSLLHDGAPADTVTVFDALISAGQADEAGGLTYLNSLAASTPSAANIASYAKVVTDRARERRLLGELQRATVAVAAGDSAQAATILRSAADAAQPMARSKALDWLALYGRSAPERDWLIDQWLTTGMTLIAGRGGVGKSLLSQQMATGIALGRDFIGRIATPRRVLVWNCEDDEDELHRRQLDICRYFGITLRVLHERLSVQPRVAELNLMMTTAYGAPTLTSVVGELAADAQRVGAELVILDNIACLFAANSNDPGHVRMFVNGLSAALRGRPFALVGHTARAAGSEFSGSAQWEAAARTRIYVGPTLPDQEGGVDESDGERDGAIYLARRKANYTHRDWLRLTFNEGVLVPDQSALDAGTATDQLRQEQARRVVLQGFDEMRRQNQNVSDASNTAAYLPKLLLQFRLNEGLSKRELDRGMRDLMLDGKLRRVEVGRYSNRTARFGLVRGDQ